MLIKNDKKISDLHHDVSVELLRGNILSRIVPSIFAKMFILNIYHIIQTFNAV